MSRIIAANGATLSISGWCARAMTQQRWLFTEHFLSSPFYVSFTLLSSFFNENIEELIFRYKEKDLLL